MQNNVEKFTQIPITFIEILAKQHSKFLSQQVKIGLRINAANAKFNGGTVLYGYSINDKKLYIINESEARIVRYVFEKYIAGTSVSNILTTLKDQGFKNRNGNDFSKSNIYNMLNNEKYTGTYIFGKHIQHNFDTKLDSNDENAVIRITNAFQAIVSIDEFEKAQEILNYHKKS